MWLFKGCAYDSLTIFVYLLNLIHHMEYRVFTFFSFFLMVVTRVTFHIRILPSGQMRN